MAFDSKEREELRRKFHDYAMSRERSLRDELITAHMGLAEYLARRFTNRGEPLDDLVQVAALGLLKAVDRFDPERGLEFSTYATPTIVGEIRRYFRDKAWSMKVPRRLQELNQAANKAVDLLAVKQGRPPTIAEIAHAIGTTEEETLEAIELGNAYDTVSLDSRMMTEAESAPMTLAEFVGGEDETLTTLQRYGDLAAAIESLEEREKVIITLRFFRDLSQAEVAKKLNISQMHVSRLQQRALSRLREMLTERRPVAGRPAASANRRVGNPSPLR